MILNFCIQINLKFSCSEKFLKIKSSEKKVNSFINNWKNYKVETVCFFISLSLFLFILLLEILKVLKFLNHRNYSRNKFLKKINPADFCIIPLIRDFAIIISSICFLRYYIKNQILISFVLISILIFVFLFECCFWDYLFPYKLVQLMKNFLTLNENEFHQIEKDFKLLNSFFAYIFYILMLFILILITSIFIYLFTNKFKKILSIILFLPTVFLILYLSIIHILLLFNFLQIIEINKKGETKNYLIFNRDRKKITLQNQDLNI